MTKELKRTFETTYTDSEKVEHQIVCKIVNPSVEQLEEAKAIYNRTWNTARKSGAILHLKLADFVKDEGLWDDNKEAKVTELRANLHGAEVKLAKGGFSLAEARSLAIEMRKWRYELRELLTIETQLENMTAESQAEEARYNYLIAGCTVYNDTGERVWKDIGEYLNPDIPAIAMAASMKYATIKWGVEDNFEEKLPENAFLKTFKFVDKNLRLIRKDGRYVDIDGKLINEEGNLVNEDNCRIDEDGNILNDDGRLVVDESLPFLDEDGNPVVVDISPAPSDVSEEASQSE